MLLVTLLASCCIAVRGPHPRTSAETGGLASAQAREEKGQAVAELIGALDQGTTSTRFMIFDHDGQEVARHQLEHEQILPRAGWVEHDPVEIWERTRTVIARAMDTARISAADLDSIGVTNQRETTVVWDRRTGVPYTNAIVWQDTRTDRIASALERDGRGKVIRHKAGLPPATYFAGGKLRWILDNVDGVREAAERGDAVFGTTDTWVLWNLTGGPDGGCHVTDVTNASRTMLMDLETLDWDDELCDILGVPRGMLPEIRPSSDPDLYGTTDPSGPFKAEVPVAGALGDQHAATVGQVCFDVGQAKNTYGTGNFLVLNTGTEVVRSTNGLLTTLCYRLGDAAAVYALEGSIAVTGSAVQWLRDQLGLIDDAAETEALASSVDDTGGVYLVPAFSGLFAPYWRSDARGVIVGLSRFNTKAHIVRATLEAICFQSRDVAEAMAADSGVRLDVLRVDGGATANDALMQLQADILGVRVSRPEVSETTALGAAYAAGLATGFWSGTDELRANWREDRHWEPEWSQDRREEAYAGWKKAVDRTLGWVDVD
jgi:glycerol kinase